ncbi:MAG TPA: zf-HC2 domain-containing protein, partial [Pyrinomonadaceae bacterium]|nr:zf-HC2 domain-containing protein [Pyrinomonadaceae bacterium]
SALTLELVMKCEVCLERLEEYLDGELAATDREQVAAHLIACGECSAEFDLLGEEQELFARYDRGVEVPPFLWTRIAARLPVARQRLWFDLVAVRIGAMAIVLIAIVILTTDKTDKKTDQKQDQGAKQVAVATTPPKQPEVSPAKPEPKRKQRTVVTRVVKPRVAEQSDVWSTEFLALDMDERDTARHIEQTEMLLRSIRNFPVPDSDEEVDVSYDKELSRRLLNENVVLRREAEMKAKFPTKTLLADLEPLLLDIANLPDRARPEEVRAIKERVQKTQIVAALMDFQDRGIE